MSTKLRNDPGVAQYLTNNTGRPFYDCLRRFGVNVLGVVQLGVYVHVECACEDTAREAARILQNATFTFLKITRKREKAKYQNDRRSQTGATTWVDTWTAHLRA
jgi:hypothetical protein